MDIPTANLSDPLNVPFNDYRIRVLGKRLKQLRTQSKRIERDIQAPQWELNERSAARKERNDKAIKVG